MLRKIFMRLKEPSTMAGLSALALLLGVPPGTIEVGAQVIGSVLAVAAIALPEEKGPLLYVRDGK